MYKNGSDVGGVVVKFSWFAKVKRKGCGSIRVVGWLTIPLTTTCVNFVSISRHPVSCGQWVWIRHGVSPPSLFFL